MDILQGPAKARDTPTPMYGPSNIFVVMVGRAGIFSTNHNHGHNASKNKHKNSSINSQPRLVTTATIVIMTIIAPAKMVIAIAILKIPAIAFKGAVGSYGFYDHDGDKTVALISRLRFCPAT